ncbi:MAG: hypothetical protein JJT96_11340 [Opitutales bacterium]|nr:hypothetical protein [Opitutales bacterium]
MIPTEIITFTVSTAIGAWIQLKAKQMETQRHQADLWAMKAGVLIDDRQRARDGARQRGDCARPGDAQRRRGEPQRVPSGRWGEQFVPPGGPLTRRIIVVSVLFAVFIAPFILAAFFPETPVFYAYAEKTRGFWFVFESIDRMRFEECRATSSSPSTPRPVRRRAGT